MKRTTMLIAGAAVAVGLGTSQVHAGHKAHDPIELNLTSSMAEGSLGATRNDDANGYSTMGCQTIAYQGGSVTGWCHAYDDTNYKSCYTTDPNLVASIRAMNGDSYVRFYWSGSVCTQIHVYNWSSAPPKEL